MTYYEDALKAIDGVIPACEHVHDDKRKHSWLLNVYRPERGIMCAPCEARFAADHDSTVDRDGNVEVHDPRSVCARCDRRFADENRQDLGKIEGATLRVVPNAFGPDVVAMSDRRTPKVLTDVTIGILGWEHQKCPTT